MECVSLHNNLLNTSKNASFGFSDDIKKDAVEHSLQETNRRSVGKRCCYFPVTHFLFLILSWPATLEVNNNAPKSRNSETQYIGALYSIH